MTISEIIEQFGLKDNDFLCVYSKEKDYFIYVGTIENIESWILDQTALKIHTQMVNFVLTFSEFYGII